MLTRILIDNFRCFSNFEFRPTQHCLIIGENGSGKTSFVDALSIVREFVATGDAVDGFGDTTNRLRSESRQIFELDCEASSASFRYRIELDRSAKGRPAFIASERLWCGSEPLLEFERGSLKIYGDDGQLVYGIPSEASRSALATFDPNYKTQRIGDFKGWLLRSLQVRPDPRIQKTAIFQGERHRPGYEMQWFLNWYRFTYQEFPERHAQYLAALREVIPGLASIALADAGLDHKLLKLKFSGPPSGDITLFFNELSDGHKMLMMLYALLYFVVAEGRDLIIDEPDNYLALREIQPWLLLVDRMLPDQGQVISVSHHPEILAGYGPDEIFYFPRVEGGVVRPEPVPYGEGNGPSLHERIARGLLNEK